MHTQTGTQCRTILTYYLTGQKWLQNGSIAKEKQPP